MTRPLRRDCVALVFVTISVAALGGCGGNDRKTADVPGTATPTPTDVAPTTTATPQNETRWPLDPDSVNFAVLVADYPTGVFEGGALEAYAPCSRCDEGAIPFTIVYNPPADFGDITFAYTETSDVVFHGTIVWMGTGKIKQPSQFEDPGAFEMLPDAPAGPTSFEYFNIHEILDDAAFQVHALALWASLKKLDIVADFAKSDYRVGFYLYPPSVGSFDPAPAKWVVFLYCGATN